MPPITTTTTTLTSTIVPNTTTNNNNGGSDNNSESASLSTASIQPSAVTTTIANNESNDDNQQTMVDSQVDMMMDTTSDTHNSASSEVPSSACSYSASAASTASAASDALACLDKLSLTSSTAEIGVQHRQYLNICNPCKIERSFIGSSSETNSDNKFIVPDWCGRRKTGAALHSVCDGEVVDTLSLDNNDYFVFGRQPTHPCDRGVGYELNHISVSRQHAAIFHNGKDDVSYIVDLGSIHGSFLNGKRLVPFQPVLVADRNVITFGLSSQKYIMRLFPKLSQIEESISNGTADALSDTDAQTKYHTHLNCMISYREPTSQPKSFASGFVKRSKSFSTIGEIIRSNSAASSIMDTIDENCHQSKLNFLSSRESGQALFCDEHDGMPPLFSSSSSSLRHHDRRVSFSNLGPEIIPTSDQEVTKRMTVTKPTASNENAKCSIITPRNLSCASSAFGLGIDDDSDDCLSLSSTGKRRCASLTNLSLASSDLGKYQSPRKRQCSSFSHLI